VSWCYQMKRWVARIKVNRKQIRIGYFDDAAEASKAWYEAAKVYHGEFARSE
jgi:hypothetical protein